MGLTERALPASEAYFLALSDALRPLHDPEQIKRTATRLLGEHLAANRVFYADAENDHWLVAKGYETGVDPLPDQPFAMATYGDWIIAGFRAGTRLVVTDMRTDGRFQESERQAHLALQIGAEIAVPLVKGGELVAMLVAHDANARHWSEREIALLEETAERTWATVERARAEAALRESEARHAFLVRFSDAVRGLTDPRAVAEVACRLAAERLGVERAYWAEIDWAANEYVIGASVHHPGVYVIAGRFPIEVWAPSTATLLEGRPWVVDDTRADPRLTPAMVEGYRHIAVGADLAAPVAVDEQLRCTLVVNQRLPRRWTPQEVALVQGVAARCWAEVERARAEAALRESEARFQALFAASPAPFLVLAPNPPDFTITAANDAYLAATLTTREGLIGRRMFDVFTDDLHRPGDHGSEALARSLDRVLTERRTDAMPRTRYDIATPSGEFEPHWWLPINAPVLDAAGEVTAIIHQVTRVTELHLAEEAERERQQRQAFLLALSDALRPLAEPSDITATATRLLGERLEASRAYYVEWPAGEDYGEVSHDYAAPGLPSLAGRYPISEFRSAYTRLVEGNTWIVDDAASASELDAAERDYYLNVGVAAWVDVPLVKGGQLQATLCLVQAQPRQWTTTEIALAKETAERCWAAIELGRAQAALRASETRLRLATSAAGISTFQIDVATGTVEFDANVLAVLYGIEGAAPDQRLQEWGPLVDSWLRPEDAQRHTELLRATMRGEGDLHNELLVRNPETGAEIWVEAQATLVRDAGGGAGRIIGIMRNITERKLSGEQRAAERQRLAVAEAVATERQALLKRVVRAEEEERRRVAHEVHDGVTQLAHAAALHLDAVTDDLAAIAPPDVFRELERARDLTRRAAEEARRLITGLRPEALDHFGLAHALRAEVDALRAEGWQATFEQGGTPCRRLAPEEEIALYRVAQEALANVRKHAGRARVRVRLEELDGHARLEVRDWGRGFDQSSVRPDPATGQQVGITGMRERMALIGGTLQVRSCPDHGTTVRALVPLHDEADA